MKDTDRTLSRKTIIALLTAGGAVLACDPAEAKGPHIYNWPTINTPTECANDLSAISSQITSGSKAHTRTGGPPHFCTWKDLSSALRHIADEIDRNHGARGWGDPPGGGICLRHK